MRPLGLSNRRCYPIMADRKRLRVDEGEDGADVGAEEAEQALNQVLELQERLDKITDEASDRVLAIEQEYTKKRRPVYKERSEVLRNIPQFWCTTLSKHPSIADMLTADDIGVLNHCVELDVEDFEDIKRGFKITFTFEAANPYFPNQQLSKSFHYAEDGALTIKGTVPDWNEELAPAEDEVLASNKRTSGREYRFMLWFMDEELEPGSHDELADIIREDIWPNPVKYYSSTGELVYDEAGAGEGELEEDEYPGAEYDEVFEGEAGAGGEGEDAAGEEEGAEGEEGEEAGVEGAEEEEEEA